MDRSKYPIVAGLLDMLDSHRAQDPDGRRLAIEIAQNMERDSKEHEMREKALLQFNLDNKVRDIAAFTMEIHQLRGIVEREMGEKAALQLKLDKKNKQNTALIEDNRRLREDNQMPRDSSTLAEDNRMLRENNRMLRETIAARDKEIKRLQEDNKVYRSACSSAKQLVGEGPSAAKRPRTNSPDGSGAQP